MNYAAAISLRQQAVCRYALPEGLPRGLEPGGLPCLVLSALHDDIDVFGSEPYEPRERTLSQRHSMSAFPSKADIQSTGQHVR